MAYLYQIYIVADEENERNIDSCIEKAFENYADIEVVGKKIADLDTGICGKCCKCGAWTSDKDKEEHIEGFSDGIFINGKWFCDLCVPPNHPKAF